MYVQVLVLVPVRGCALRAGKCVCVCVRARVHMHVRMRARMPVRACAVACVCAGACVRANVRARARARTCVLWPVRVRAWLREGHKRELEAPVQGGPTAQQPTRCCVKLECSVILSVSCLTTFPPRPPHG